MALFHNILQGKQNLLCIFYISSNVAHQSLGYSFQLVILQLCKSIWKDHKNVQFSHLLKAHVFCFAALKSINLSTSLSWRKRLTFVYKHSLILYSTSSNHFKKVNKNSWSNFQVAYGTGKQNSRNPKKNPHLLSDYRRDERTPASQLQSPLPHHIISQSRSTEINHCCPTHLTHTYRHLCDVT